MTASPPTSNYFLNTPITLGNASRTRKPSPIMPHDLTEYDCTQCGACCRSFPIFASETDATREPAICNEARALPEHLQTEDKAYQLFPLPFQTRCPYLKDDELCRIYETRPSVCRRFSAGSEQCMEARRRQGIGNAEP